MGVHDGGTPRRDRAPGLWTPIRHPSISKPDSSGLWSSGLWTPINLASGIHGCPRRDDDATETQTMRRGTGATLLTWRLNSLAIRCGGDRLQRDSLLRRGWSAICASMQIWRDEELRHMYRTFYDPDSYHEARRNFVYKRAAEATRPRLATHRVARMRRTALRSLAPTQEVNHHQHRRRFLH